MATKTWLMSVYLTVEQPGERADGEMPSARTHYEIREAVTTAIAQQFACTPDTRVRWESMINRRAVVDGRLLCDEHLPQDHPIAF